MPYQKYIKANDTFVNLEQISNINVLEHRNRIVFNFGYSVAIEVRGNNKVISDYIYSDFDNEEDFQKSLKDLYSNDYVKENFITQGLKGGLINKSKISSFKVQPEKLRIIFNMSHGVEITANNKDILAPEFVYVNFDTKDEYNQYIELINKTLVR